MTATALPRVTEILRAVGLAPDFSAVPEAVLEAARERGVARHAAIEADHYGLVEPEQEPLLGGYRKFLSDTGHVPWVSEGGMTNKVWGYAGHPDRVGQQGQTVVLIEWKPMGTNLTAATYQLAAYRSCYEPSTLIDVGLVVELNDDSYRMTDVTQDLAAAWQIFQAAIVVYRAQQEMRR